ncbi:MAG: RDD family protein [Myxococcales bacterium]|nr:RDD family protein [Myxococcales bacterium]
MRRVHVIVTPENVPFELELAGPTARALGWAADVAVIAALTGLSACLIASRLQTLGGFAHALFFVLAFVAQWWYRALTEWWLGGQTPGKRLVGIRVVDARGLRVRLSQTVLRHLVGIVDLLPALYLVGGLCVLIDPRARRLGDIAAGTLVVRERPPVAPRTVVAPDSEAFAFARSAAVVHAARRLSPRERDAMLLLARRRDQLPVATRHELFGRLEAYLRARLGLERPPSLSPENFVLGLTAAALQPALGTAPRTSTPPAWS